MNTLPKVDVLGVIDREITTRDDAAIACKAAGERLDALVHAEERDELKAARAAVADLVAKSQTASVLLRSLIDALGETEFTEGDLEVANELDAALANIGPQS